MMRPAMIRRRGFLHSRSFLRCQKNMFRKEKTEVVGDERQLEKWVEEAVARGAGEIILTAIDQEGTMTGYDLDFIRRVVDAVAVPVIAHGGAGTLAHLKQGIVEAHASGVAAASIFHFTDQSPIKARLYLKNEGVNVRV